MEGSSPLLKAFFLCRSSCPAPQSLQGWSCWGSGGECGHSYLERTSMCVFLLVHPSAHPCLWLCIGGLVLGVTFPDTLPSLQKLLRIDARLHQQSQYLFWHLVPSPSMALVQALTTVCCLAAMKNPCNYVKYLKSLNMC